MKILELAGFYSNYGSNFIPTMENLDNYLSIDGHQVFFAFSNKNPSEDFYKWEKPFEKKHNTRLLNFNKLSFVFESIKIIKELDIDVVHAHFTKSFFVSLIKLFSPKKVRFYQHIHTCPYENKKCFRAFIKRIRNFLFFDKKVNIVCISNAMKPLVKYIFPLSPITVCLNCIDFSRLEERQFNRLEKFSVLLFGYNYYVKGVDIAIKAGEIAKEKIPNFHLDIIMGANLLENTNKIIDEFGCIPDFVSILKPTNNILPEYQNHNVFLNSSRSEGGSYAILEAYYCGCQCVVSDVPATKESNLPNVVYFKCEDEISLANAFVLAYQQKNDYCNNTKYVIDEFSINSWCKNVKAMLKL